MIEQDLPLPLDAELASGLDALVAVLIQAVHRRLSQQRNVGSTYRLQFQDGIFGFNEAKQLVEYLRNLGISHVYASPCLQTRRGSTHGYDIVDHAHLNERLGGAAAFASFVTALHQSGLGLILDIVPNHMCIADDRNLWWMDVLASGAASPYASHFDIDWHPVKRELENRVLLPVLDEPYGNVLDAGRLPIEYRDGEFHVACGEMKWPLDPQTWTQILSPRLEELIESLGVDSADTLELQSIITALEHLPHRTETASKRVEERRRESQIVQSRLDRLVTKSPAVRNHIMRNVNLLNGTRDDTPSFDALHRLLERQAYRLGYWKTASDELNYRRFFDVTELAALSMENIDVFEAAHWLPLELAVRQQVDGFRVDHVDGLFDPEEYLWRLQWSYLRALGQDALQGLDSQDFAQREWSSLEPHYFRALRAELDGPDPRRLLSGEPNLNGSVDATCLDGDETHWNPPESPLRSTGRAPLLVLVEKILGANEPLPSAWPVEGTTGYDFANIVNGLYVDPEGLVDLRRTYVRFSDQKQAFRQVVYECKRLILGRHMQSEIQLLANRLDRLSERHRRTRDFTLNSLRSALQEVVACFPVYRSYIRRGHVSERDRRAVLLSVAQARRQRPMIQPSVFEFVRDVLLLTQPTELDNESRRQREFFVGRFQQVTSPVMAKGVEDTALYRYIPLASLNDVGGDPSSGVSTIEDFHHHQEDILRQWPQSMTSTSTHDTKRSEDVRARINVLSEISGPWRKAVQRWARWNRRHRREVDGQAAPSRNDEWLFYQTLVGVWPLTTPSDEERATLIQRLQQYMEKACHEAKLHTSWINPNRNYDRAVHDFIAEVLGDPHRRFFQDFQSFLESVVDAGLYNAMSQTLIKLTSPGIPDIYQGQELWDFSLVDPDNRRPVDFKQRQAMLAELRTQTETAIGRDNAAAHFARSSSRRRQDVCDMDGHAVSAAMGSSSDQGWLYATGCGRIGCGACLHVRASFCG